MGEEKRIEHTRGITLYTATYRVGRNAMWARLAGALVEWVHPGASEGLPSRSFPQGIYLREVFPQDVSPQGVSSHGEQEVFPQDVSPQGVFSHGKRSSPMGKVSFENIRNSSFSNRKRQGEPIRSHCVGFFKQKRGIVAVHSAIGF